MKNNPKFTKKRILKNLFLFFLIGITPQLYAEEKPFTLEDCIQLAYKTNPDILNAEIMKKEAGSMLSQANASRYPEITAVATGGYISEQNVMAIGDMTAAIAGLPEISIPGREMEIGAKEKADLSLSLVQPVYTGGRIENGIKMAMAGVHMAALQTSLEKKNIRADVTRIFYQLAQAMEYKKVAVMSLDQIKRHLEDVKNLVDQGMVLKSDIYPVDIRRLDTELMIVKAENAISRTQAALAERMGFSPEKKISIKIDWDSIPPWPVPIQFFTEQVKRDEQKITEKKLEIAASEIDVAKGALKPTVGLSASAHYGYPGFESLDPDWDTWWQAGVNVSFTLFDMNKKREEKNAAIFRKKRLEKTKEALDHKISLDRINARLAYEEAYRNMKISGEKVLSAEENFRLKNDNYKVGMTTNTDFLDAHLELMKAQADKVLSSAELRIAWSDFLRAMGKDVSAEKGGY